MEEKVFIRCLKKDIPLVKGVISQSVSEYKKVIKEQLDQDIDVDLQVDEQRCLEERPIPDYQNLKLEEFTDEHERLIKVDRSVDTQKCFGGVILTNSAMNIMCKNTLDVRVQQSFSDCLPNIREMLFGKVEFKKK
jgi:vacuolar-type H+-ATPase subunit E/Vma4